MRIGEGLPQISERTEPMTMKQKKRIWIIWYMLLGILFPVFAAFTGCGREKAEFLAAAEEAAGADGEDPAAAEEPAETNAAESAAERKSGAGAEASETEGKEIPKQEEAAAGITPGEPEIYVDVCGAVRTPGVYALAAGSRVFQAIEKAGGFLEEAAGEYVNRAQPLSDGQQIYIPTREEAESQSMKVQAPAADSGGQPDMGTAAQESTKVNLNTADIQTLMTLNGIGESKAQAILAYREEHGGFSSIEELMDVQGIKEGTFTKIKENIAVE